MSYRILHFSDLKLDKSFVGQGFPLEYGIERRLSLRATLSGILARARELRVDIVTIGGNLFVQELLSPETAIFIRQQFALLSPTRVIIAPGDKDPYTNESPYAQLNWPENVDIFYQSKLTHLKLADNIHLWGACNPLMLRTDLLEGFRSLPGTNILLLHISEETNHAETLGIRDIALKNAGFSLALMGGKHVSDIQPTNVSLLVYPGSPEPLQTDQTGLHQVVLVEVDQGEISVQPLSLQQWNYQIVEIDITKCSSTEDVAQLVDTTLETVIAQSPHSAISVRLIGQPHFDLDLSKLRLLIQTPSFFRIEDRLGLTYDLEQLAREQTVRGLLVRRFQERILNSASEFEKHQQLTALRFALQALEGKQVSLYEVKED